MELTLDAREPIKFACNFFSLPSSCLVLSVQEVLACTSDLNGQYKIRTLNEFISGLIFKQSKLMASEV